MNKEKLIEMGLTEELATSVMKELDGNYVPKARFNEVNTELKQAKDQVKERDSQLETLKKNVGDSEELKKQIETLQNDNKTKDEAHAAEIKQIKIDAAVDKALADAKAKNPKAVKALLDLAKAEISDDGTIQLANITPETEAPETTDAAQSPTGKPTDIEMEETGNDTLGETEKSPLVLVATVALIAVACITVIVSIVRKRHSVRQPVKVAIEETEGGAEE